MIAQNVVLHHVAHFHPLDAVVKRDPCARNRSRARSAIGLYDVAIDGDLPLTELSEIDDGPERAPDKPLNFLRAA